MSTHHDDPVDGLESGDWALELRPHGWVRLRATSTAGPNAYLRYVIAGPPHRERIELRACIIEATGDPITGSTWKRLPLSSVEEVLSAVMIDPWRPTTPGEPPDELRSMRAEFAPADPDAIPFTDPALDALDRYFEDTCEGSFLAQEFDASIPGEVLERRRSAYAPTGDLPQLAPPNGRITSAFLESVAEVYRWMLAEGRSPAPGIAEHVGVPVRTAHRWIYQARQRGILPPARVGRAG